jgi:hypothetical protein
MAKPESAIIRLLPYISVYTRVHTDNFYYFEAWKPLKSNVLVAEKR